MSRHWPPTRALKGVTCFSLLLLSGAAIAQPAPDGAAVPALDWQQSQQRLEQVSDALAAADASVRNKQDLQDATRLLRLPEITGEV
ncbi:MAG: TolC family protein, partial [Stenotrophomonas maltophilia]